MFFSPSSCFFNDINLLIAHKVVTVFCQQLKLLTNAKNADILLRSLCEVPWAGSVGIRTMDFS